MNTQNLSTLKIHKLTREQYERELAAGRIDPNALYLTPDEEIDLSGYATIEQLSGKADKASSLEGYGIADAYTKTEIDAKIDNLTVVSEGTAEQVLEEAKAYFDDNRTHWVESFSGEVLPLTQLQAEDYNEDVGAFVVNGIELVDGGTYVVNWNDYEHTCVATSVFLDGVEFIALGNTGIIDGTGDNGLPFIIIYSETLGNFLMVTPLDEAMPLVSISGTFEKVYKLDNKFLRIGELIKNTNIENGSAIGAIRTTGSAQENEEYTIGTYAFTEGYNTKASGDSSHTEGVGTVASSYAQHVQGRHNIEDVSGNYAHIVGNGTSENARSNAHTLDWDGNAWFAGEVTIGQDNVPLVTETELNAVADAALPRAGGALTGDKLYINNDKGMVAAWTDSMQLRHFTDDANYTAFILSDTQEDIANAARLSVNENGAWKATYKLYGEHNKPTPANIGAAAESTHNLKTYTNPSQLGLTDAASITDILNKMPQGSKFTYSATKLTDTSWNFPSTVGYVEFTKESANRYNLRLFEKTGGIWVSETDSNSGIPTGVWHPIMTDTKLLWSGQWSSGSISVPDIGKYKVIRIRTATSRNIYGTVLDEGTAVVGGGVSYNDSKACTLTTALFFTRSGNTLTIKNFEVLKLAAGASPTAVTDSKTIYEIWGVEK